MVVSDLKEAVIIELNWINARRVKKVLGRMAKTDIAIIDIWCLNDTKKFVEIKKLLNGDNRLKIFHGGSEAVFNDMVKPFSLEGRKDVVYLRFLESRMVAHLYQKHIFKPFSPAFSSNSSTGFEEV